MNRCLICQSRSFKIFAEIKKRQLLACIDCQLLRIEPIPTKKKIKKLLDQLSPIFVSEYIKETAFYKEYFSKKIAHLNQLLPNKGKLVDIGSGPGIFLNIAGNLGWNCTGVDLSAQAVKIGKKLFGVDITLGDGVVSDLNLQKFDLATAFQVIEHLPDPDKFLKKMHGLLKPNGLIVLTTPDRHSLLAKISGKHWFEYYNLEHLFYFNENNLKKLVENAGFEIIFCKIESSRKLSLEYLLNRLTNYYYTQGTKLYPIISLSRRLTKNFNKLITFREPWVNIYLVARKRA